MMTANTAAKNNKSFLSIAEQESKKNVFPWRNAQENLN